MREPWPSVYTSTDLSEGIVDRGEGLLIRSEMHESGVLFGDGIEGDAIDMRYGAEVTLTLAAHRLLLVR